MPRPDTPPSATTTAPRRQDRRVVCLALAETAFEVLTVGINLADVVSDIVVAAQFYREGDMAWFWLVVVFLALAHAVYVVVAMHFAPKWAHWQRVGWNRSEHFFRRLLFTLVFAQLLPVMNLVLQKAYANAQEKPRESESSDTRVATRNAHKRPRAVEEELQRVENSKFLHERMTRALGEHFSRFGFFYVESAFEAAPQAIVQLLAITFLGRASWVQLVSLCCSLFSITSKGVVLSRAYDVRVMVFKFALVAHDVFSTFYLFSTLVAVETPKETDFFGLPVSWLGWVCLWKMAITVGLAVLCGLYALWATWMWSSYRPEVRICAVIQLSSMVLFAPLLIVFETAKLTWLLGFLTYHESRHVALPSAVIFSFLTNDDASSSRLRHLLVAAWAAQATEGARDTGDSLLRDVHSFMTFMPPYAHTILKRAADASRPISLTIASWIKIESVFVSNLRRELCNSSLPSGAAVYRAMIVMGAFTAIAQSFSLVYPVLNLLLYRADHNLLQSTCLVATLTAAAVALVCSPRAWVYAHVNFALRDIISAHFHDPQMVALLQLIQDFHEPPHVGVLQTAVAVLPLELGAIVGGYLTPKDIGIDQLSIEECRLLRAKVMGTFGAVISKKATAFSAQAASDTSSECDIEALIERDPAFLGATK